MKYFFLTKENLKRDYNKLFDEFCEIARENKVLLIEHSYTHWRITDKRKELVLDIFPNLSEKNVIDFITLSLASTAVNNVIVLVNIAKRFGDLEIVNDMTGKIVSEIEELREDIATVDKLAINNKFEEIKNIFPKVNENWLKYLQFATDNGISNKEKLEKLSKIDIDLLDRKYFKIAQTDILIRLKISQKNFDKAKEIYYNFKKYIFEPITTATYLDALFNFGSDEMMEEGIKLADEYLEKDTQYDYIWTVKAKILNELGRPDEARKVYEDAYKMGVRTNDLVMNFDFFLKTHGGKRLLLKGVFLLGLAMFVVSVGIFVMMSFSNIVDNLWTIGNSTLQFRRSTLGFEVFPDLFFASSLLASLGLLLIFISKYLESKTIYFASYLISKNPATTPVRTSRRFKDFHFGIIALIITLIVMVFTFSTNYSIDIRDGDLIETSFLSKQVTPLEEVDDIKVDYCYTGDYCKGTGSFRVTFENGEGVYEVTESTVRNPFIEGSEEDFYNQLKNSGQLTPTEDGYLRKILY